LFIAIENLQNHFVHNLTIHHHSKQVVKEWINVGWFWVVGLFKPIQYSTKFSIEPFKCPFGKANGLSKKIDLTFQIMDDTYNLMVYF